MLSSFLGSQHPGAGQVLRGTLSDNHNHLLSSSHSLHNPLRKDHFTNEGTNALRDERPSPIPAQGHTVAELELKPRLV